MAKDPYNCCFPYLRTEGDICASFGFMLGAWACRAAVPSLFELSADSRPPATSGRPQLADLCEKKISDKLLSNSRTKYHFKD